MKKHLLPSDLSAITHNLPALSRDFKTAKTHADSCVICKKLIDAKKKKFKMKKTYSYLDKNCEIKTIQYFTLDRYDLKRIGAVVLGVVLLGLAFYAS